MILNVAEGEVTGLMQLSKDGSAGELLADEFHKEWRLLMGAVDVVEHLLSDGQRLCILLLQSKEARLHHCGKTRSVKERCNMG